MFLAFLAYENLSLKQFKLQERDSSKASLGKGALAALLSPYPYIFWMTAGATLLLEAWKQDHNKAVWFLLVFLLFFFLAKICLAFFVVKSRQWMGTGALTWVVRVLGVVFVAYAFLLVKQGIEMFM